MSEQWERLTRSIGNVFLPIVKRVLPYVNGILMALVEIVDVIASLLGYNPEDFDFFTEPDSSVIDLTEDINNATDSTENLKKSMLGLRSFDKLINITTPKDTGAGANVGTGISADVLKLFNDTVDDYNSKLEDTQMKATKIRDSIMEWLGFTKIIDEETGDISFKFDHITGGTVLGALSVGGSIFMGVSKILSLLKKYGIVGSSKSVLSGLFGGGEAGTLFSLITKKLPLILLLVGEFQYISKNREIIDKLKEIKESFIELGEALKPLVIALFPGLKNILKELPTTWNEFFEIANGGLLILLDTLNTFINTLTSIVTGNFSRLKEIYGMGKYIEEAYESLTNGTKNAGQSITDEWGKMKQAVSESSMSQFEDIDFLVDSLGDLVDSNGKVKKSDQERAKLIIKELNKALGTEYKLENGIITQNGKAVKSNQDLADSISKVVAQKKAQIILDAYKDDYVTALKQQKNYQERINELEQLYAQYESDSTEEGRIKFNMIKAELDTQKNKIATNNKTIQDYDNLLNANASNNIDKINNALKTYGIETEKAMNKSNEKIISSGYTTTQKLIKNISTQFTNFEAIFKVDADTTKAKTSINNLLDGLSFVLTTASGMKFPKLKADGGVYAGGQWQNIARYDGGGTPKTGQLFWARENGLPEMVGQIGGHTAVMNNDQIVGSVASGVYKAVVTANSQTQKSSENATYNFYLDQNNKLATYTLDKLKGMAKSNGKPITLS